MRSCVLALALLDFYRNWQDRRVACTKDVIAFARVGDSVLLDAIPLSEVLSVELMVSADHRIDQQDLPTNSYDNVVDFTHAFQIRTMKNGQNAGRKYVLRADSDAEVAALIGQFSELSKKAFQAQRDAAKSWRNKLLEYVRRVYGSSLFQIIFATLIIAVSCFLPSEFRFVYLTSLASRISAFQRLRCKWKEKFCTVLMENRPRLNK
jgi:hypothetical protein